jgi:hypothetical protein
VLARDDEAILDHDPRGILFRREWQRDRMEHCLRCKQGRKTARTCIVRRARDERDAGKPWIAVRARSQLVADDQDLLRVDASARGKLANDPRHGVGLVGHAVRRRALP